MGQTKEQRMIKQLTSTKVETKTPIATDMFIPNHSGKLDAGKVYATPTDSYNVVNKKYLDDNYYSITQDKYLLNTGDTGNGSYHFYADTAVGLNIWGKSNAASAIYIRGYSTTTTTKPQLQFIKSNSNTVGGYAAIAGNTNLGRISFGGHYDATSSNADGAFIEAVSVGTWTATNYGAYMRFYTTAQNSTTNTERMRISSDGYVGINCTPTAQLEITGTVNPAILITNGDSQASYTGINQQTASDTAGINSANRYYRARGTITTRTAIQSGDTIANLNFYGFNGTNWSTLNAYMNVEAAENFSTTNMGTTWTFYNTVTGSTSAVDFFEINGNGGVIVNNAGRSDVFFRVEGDTNNNLLYCVSSTDRIGINTSAPDRKLEINSTDGTCLRLTYNDNSGSAANYADFLVTSGGDLIINPRNGTLTIGAARAGYDYCLTFDGETNDGVLYWMEDEDYFKFNDDVVFSEAIATTALSPAQITGNTNNWAVNTNSFVRYTADGEYNLTGIVAGLDGQRLTLVNVGANKVTITNQDAASNAANRFTTTTAGSLEVTQNKVANMIYDAQSTTWRVWLE